MVHPIVTAELARARRDELQRVAAEVSPVPTGCRFPPLARLD